LNDNCVVDDEFACQKLYMSEFMIICCWWCFGTCYRWNDTMGIPICELVMRIVVVVEKLW